MAGAKFPSLKFASAAGGEWRATHWRSLVLSPRKPRSRSYLLDNPPAHIQPFGKIELDRLDQYFAFE